MIKPLRGILLRILPSAVLLIAGCQSRTTGPTEPAAEQVGQNVRSEKTASPALQQITLEVTGMS
ncbi:MAG: hypothetical protein HYV60_21500 [Planctomycetia bacterium]|nr:hypothetical protein [Planctomycetia bacterium]